MLLYWVHVVQWMLRSLGHCECALLGVVIVSRWLFEYKFGLVVSLSWFTTQSILFLYLMLSASTRHQAMGLPDPEL